MISVLVFVNAVAVSVKGNEVVVTAPFTMPVGKAFVPPTSVALQVGATKNGKLDAGNVIVIVQLVPGVPAKVMVNCPLPPAPDTVPIVLVPQADGTMLPATWAVPVTEEEPKTLPVTTLADPPLNWFNPPSKSALVETLSV